MTFLALQCTHRERASEKESEGICNALILSPTFHCCRRMLPERLVPVSLLCWRVEKHPTGRTTKKVSERASWLHNTTSRCMRLVCLRKNIKDRKGTNHKNPVKCLKFALSFVDLCDCSYEAASLDQYGDCHQQLKAKGQATKVQVSQRCIRTANTGSCWSRQKRDCAGKQWTHKKNRE